jgi:hypothetical protein
LAYIGHFHGAFMREVMTGIGNPAQSHVLLVRDEQLFARGGGFAYLSVDFPDGYGGSFEI